MSHVRPVRFRLRLNEPSLADELLAFFRRRESTAELVGADVIELAILHTLSEEQGRMELDLYLRVWETLHPDAPVDVLE